MIYDGNILKLDCWMVDLQRLFWPFFFATHLDHALGGVLRLKRYISGTSSIFVSYGLWLFVGYCFLLMHWPRNRPEVVVLALLDDRSETGCFCTEEVQQSQKHGLFGGLGGVFEQRRCTKMCNNLVYPWRWRILGGSFFGRWVKSPKVWVIVSLNHVFQEKFFFADLLGPKQGAVQTKISMAKTVCAFSEMAEFRFHLYFLQDMCQTLDVLVILYELHHGKSPWMTPPFGIIFSDFFHIFMQTHEILEGQY